MIEAYTSVSALFTDIGNSLTFLPFPFRSVIVGALGVICTLMFIKLVKMIIEAII